MAEFKNPSQQGGQDGKSLLVMMFVMVAVFFGLQYFRGKNTPPPSSPATTQSAPAQPGAQSGTTASPAPNAAVGTPAAAATVPTVQAAAESTTTIENELYRITFTNRGGRVANWILKQYKDTDGKPLDLVHHQAAQQFGYPLSLYTYDPAVTAAVNNALYVPSATGNLAAPASLTFKYSDGSLQVTKTFSFNETYVLHADVAVTRAGSPIRALVSWPGGFGDQDNCTGLHQPQASTSSATAESSISNPRRSPVAIPSTVPSPGPASAAPTSPPSSCLTIRRMPPSPLSTISST